MIDSFALEDIDRAVFNVIRLRLVNLGLLPDVTLYATAQEYADAKQAIIDNSGTTGKELTEVYGIGGAEDRGERKPHKVTINRKTTQAGSLGAFGITEFIKNEKEDGSFTYTKQRIPAGNRDITYEIRVMTNSTRYDRILTEMLYQELGHTRYISTYKSYTEQSGKKFLMNFIGDIDVSATSLQERLFTYVARDLWVEPPTIIRAGIPPLTSVSFVPRLVYSGDDLPADRYTGLGDNGKIIIVDN